MQDSNVAVYVPIWWMFCVMYRGGSRVFLRRGCTSKEWRHWRWGLKKIKREYVYTKKKASSQGREGGGMRTPCTLPLDPPLMYMPMVGLVQVTPWFRSSMWISSVADMSKILCASVVTSATRIYVRMWVILRLETHFSWCVPLWP